MQLVKLAVRVPETRQSVEDVVKRHTSSSLLEVQQRSCEFDRLFRSSIPNLFSKLLEAMPAMTEAEYMKATGAQALQSTTPGIIMVNRLDSANSARLPPCKCVECQIRNLIWIWC